jgi:hypothetical protein
MENLKGIPFDWNHFRPLLAGDFQSNIQYPVNLDF